MNLGLAIKKLRKNKNLNQKNFCKITGITQGYLSQIENEKREPSIDLIKKIALSLNIPIPVLFWFTLTKEDVKKNKIEMYTSLKGALDKLVYSFFN